MYKNKNVNMLLCYYVFKNMILCPKYMLLCYCVLQEDFQ